MDNFQWTDELVEEFALQVKVNGHTRWVTEQMDKFKESKQSNLDYEILTYINPNIVTDVKDGNIIKPDNYAVFKNYPIHSVKRLSDDKVFTIGDTVGCILNDTMFVVKEIELSGEPYLINKELHHFMPLRNAFKPNATKTLKQPLFITEDNVPIYEGVTYWSVDLDLWEAYDGQGFIKNEEYFDNHKIFSTEEKANDYILFNKPLFTATDIFGIIKNNYFTGKALDFYLKELAKTKLNG